MSLVAAPLDAGALLRSRRRFAAGLATALVVIGLVVLVGWFAGIPVLTSIVPGLVTMKPLTAVAIIAVGVLLMISATAADHRIGARGLGPVCLGLSLGLLALGLASLLQDLTGTAWGYENVLGLDSGASAAAPGRPAPPTAACLVLLGCAFLALRAQRHVTAQVLSVTVSVISYLAFLGYVFGVSTFYRVSDYTSMAVHTSVALVVAGLGVLHVRADRGLMPITLDQGPGGAVARRVLPITILGPPLVGLISEAGAGLGWYDRQFALVITITVLSVGGGLLVRWQAGWLQHIDLRRAGAEDALARIRRAESDRAQAMRRLEVANADLERFAAIAAHDLRSPLTTIGGYAELIGDSPAVAGDRQAADLAARIERLVGRGTEMIDDLLTYSRSGLGSATLDALELQRIVEQIAGEVSEAAGREAHIDVRDLPVVLGEVGQLRQLFANLLANAVKYVPDERTAHVVVDALPAHEGRVTIRVTDNGLGIPQEERERLFTIFQRGSRTTHIAGSGVGLAICERIVGRHGGRIWVEDGPEAGSRFCLTLSQRLG